MKYTDKLLVNLKRYNSFCIWSESCEIIDFLNSLKVNNFFPLIEKVYVDESNYIDVSNYVKNEISVELQNDNCEIISECLVLICDKNSFIIQQDFFIKYGTDLAIVNVVDYKDFYNDKGIILNERPLISEEEYVENLNNNPNIKITSQYVDLLAKKQPLFKSVEIETINKCNGKCSFCPINVKNDKRPLSIMDADMFYSIIDQLRKIEYSGRLALFCNNEPFLDKRIIEFSEYAYNSLPYAKIHLFTNGSKLDIDNIQKILPYIDEFIIDNYNDDMVLNPNIKAIYENISKFKFFERIKIVLRKQNEILTSRGGYAPNRKILDTVLQSKSCVLPYVQITIRPNGDCGTCSNSPMSNYSLGNLKEKNILDIWYGEKYSSFRKRILEGRYCIEECKNCDVVHLY